MILGENFMYFHILTKERHSISVHRIHFLNQFCFTPI